MDSIVAQIQALAQSVDEATRLAIQRSLRQVQVELQSPMDTLMELANANLLIGACRIGADLGIFHLLAKHDNSMSVSQLSEITGASPDLLERILRHLAATSVVKEVKANEYQACNVTYVLADSKGEGMVYYGFDTFGPIVQAMPDFFIENKYQDVTSHLETPFQKAFHTKLSCFDWLVQNPKHFQSLQKIMTALEGAEWTVGFDILDTEAKKVPPTAPQPSERPFFVDIGGGHGHQCTQLGKKYPNLLGRLVLQDLPEAVNKLSPIEGVKAEVYDFFQEQPITGAKFYYLRRIMHDWPDKEATYILQNTANAMSSGSRILIDEVVLPDTGAHWQATLADLSMMIAFGGKERSRQQWQRLAHRAGLRIEEIHNYAASTYTSIVVLVKQ